MAKKQETESAKKQEHKGISRKELEQLPKKYIIAFAVRSALRVFPLLATEGNLDFWKKATDQRIKYTQAVWKAIEHAQKVSLNKEQDLSSAAYAAAAAAADTAADTAAAAAYAAAYAAAAADTAADTAAAYAAAYAAASDVDRVVFYHMQWEDYDSLKKGIHALDTIRFLKEFYQQPLWSKEVSFFKEWLQRLQKVFTGVDNELIEKVYHPYLTLINNMVSPTDYAGRREERATPVKDSFEREKWAGILANQLRYANKNASNDKKTAQTAYTMGLFGHWGTGKTGFVKYLTDALYKENSPKEQFFVATFNAWTYQDADNYRAVMAQAILEGIKEGKKGAAKWRLMFHFHRKLAWKRHKGMLYALIALLLCWIGYQAYNYFTDREGFKLISQGNISVGISGLLVLLYGFLNSAVSFTHSPIMGKLSSLFFRINYRKQIGEIAVLKEELSLLCKVALKEKHKLLVIIDDLDRCHTACINETLDTVRLLYDIKNVYQLIAVDQRIVLEAVQERYEKLGKRNIGIARDFLAKIIEFPISLREVREEEIKNFVADNLFTELNEKASENPEKPSSEIASIPVKGEKNRQEQPNTEGNEPTLIPISKGVPEKEEQEKKFVYKEWKPVEEERTIFTELALEYGFKNPRMLKRLYNAHAFLCVLEGVTKQSEDTSRIQQSEVLARLLFLLEYQEIQQEETEDVEEREQKIKELTIEAFGKDRYADLRETVSCFVLPS